jgi:hydroxymethylbilane synthase
LALAQASQVRDRLALAAPDRPSEIVVIRTTGDAVQDRPLAEIGGKGLFTREIDEAVLAGRVDLAVHSMKDVPTYLPAGLVVACILEREDPRDAFLCLIAGSLAQLPPGARVGTASLRRAAQLLHRRPDLAILPLRGNVETRLKRLEEGRVDATLLAMAGLKRLGLAGRVTCLLDPDEMLPAVAQGAIGLACRADRSDLHDLLAPLDHAASHACVRAERAFLAVLDGSCRTPIAGLAEPAGDRLVLRGRLIAPDGRSCAEVRLSAPAAEAEGLGRAAGERLRAWGAS